MNTDQILALKKKIKFSSVPNSWCGFLASDEILHIVDRWRLPSVDRHSWAVIGARERMSCGDRTPAWFYFILTRKDQNRLKIED